MRHEFTLRHEHHAAAHGLLDHAAGIDRRIVVAVRHGGFFVPGDVEHAAFAAVEGVFQHDAVPVYGTAGYANRHIEEVSVETCPDLGYMIYGFFERPQDHKC